MKKKRRLKLKVRAFLTFVVAIVLFGYVSFSVINYGVSKKKYEAEEKRLQTQLYELKDKETVLNQEISKLKDEDYLARYAREEYLYSKDGEYVIKIDEKKSAEAAEVENEINVPTYIIILNTLLVGLIIAGLAFLAAKIKKVPKKKVSVVWYFFYNLISSFKVFLLS